jgi:hypothetical protein
MSLTFSTFRFDAVPAAVTPSNLAKNATQNSCDSTPDTTNLAAQLLRHREQQVISKLLVKGSWSLTIVSVNKLKMATTRPPFKLSFGSSLEFL